MNFDPTPQCAHGHKERIVGCVSCVLVFDRPAEHFAQSKPDPCPEAIGAIEAICRICQMRLPERLVTYAPGPRGGVDAVCAADCGRAGLPVDEAKRAEVIAMRRAR